MIKIIGLFLAFILLLVFIRIAIEVRNDPSMPIFYKIICYTIMSSVIGTIFKYLIVIKPDKKYTIKR